MNECAGGRGGGSKPDKAKTKEELDAEMDSYFLKDEKSAPKKLDADLDDYWKSKPVVEAATEAAEETPAE